MNTKITQNEIIGFNIDFVRFRTSFILPIFNRALNLTNTTNTNIYRENDFVFTRITSAHSIASGILALNDTPIINIRVLGDGIAEYSYYGAFFTLGFLSYMLYDILHYENPRITRLDLALDVRVSVDETVNNNFTLSTPPRVTFTDNKGGTTTAYIFGQKNSGNKYGFTRIYNKKLDTEKKGKAYLYEHHKNEPIVTRIESEIRSRYLDEHNTLLSDLTNDLYLKNMYLKFNTKKQGKIKISKKFVENYPLTRTYRQYESKNDFLLREIIRKIEINNLRNEVLEILTKKYLRYNTIALFINAQKNVYFSNWN